MKSDINPGSLLPALSRMERTRRIKAEWRATENNRRAKRRYYAPEPFLPRKYRHVIFISGSFSPRSGALLLLRLCQGDRDLAELGAARGSQGSSLVGDNRTWALPAFWTVYHVHHG
jgi:hypothetical protein